MQFRIGLFLLVKDVVSMALAIEKLFRRTEFYSGAIWLAQAPLIIFANQKKIVFRVIL
jgi:hypothetical protein